MADLTPTEILAAIAPKLAVLPTAATFLKMAENRIAAAWDGGWGEAVRSEAVAYMAAHMGTMAARNYGTGGAVTAMREGDQQVSFAAPSTLPSWATDLGQTSYGLHLLGIIQGQVLPLGVTTDEFDED